MVYKNNVRDRVKHIFGDLIIKRTYINWRKYTERKATRMIGSIRYLDYEERLKVLKLPSLFYRRYRGDMIAVYNLLNGKYDIDYSDFFTFSTTIYPHQRPYVQEFMPGDIFFYEKSG